MTGAAATKREVAADVTEEEAAESSSQRASHKGRIAASLGLVVSLALLFFSPQVTTEPGITAFSVIVAGAAAFCWDVYGRPMLHAASLHAD